MTDNVVTVNGQPRALAGTAAHTNALDWLRRQGLSGAKEGCAEGECGACAVLLATPTLDGRTEWTPVNSCLVPAYALDGQEIITSEGLGGPDALHPVQQKLAEAGGSQCGYCTPGFACSMAGEYYRAGRAPVGHAPASAVADAPTAATVPTAVTALSGGAGPAAGADKDDVGCPVLAPVPGVDAEHGPNGFDLHALSGNLCRCTGYRPIRDAAYTLGMPAADDPLQQRLASPAPASTPTDVTVDGLRFVRPATLDQAVRMLRDEPETMLAAGATDWGVEVNVLGKRAPLVLALEQLAELRTLDITDDAVEIGAALTLSEIEQRLGDGVPLLAELIPQFASRLIRNRATLGGNLATGSPIGDGAPALLALGAHVVLTSADGEREVDLTDYFTGYRTTVRRSDELIRAVRIPLPLARTTAFHKIAKRRFDDISSVSVAFALDIDDGTVTGARIGLGGVAATPLRARDTEKALIGRPWTLDSVRQAAAVLGGEGTPMSDLRASAEYRGLMLQNALLKLYSTTSEEVPA